MAQYTIITTREQEAALTYSFDNFAAEGQTKAQYLQERVSHMVLEPMVIDFNNSKTIALDESIATIPEENEAKAKAEIEAVIVSNGGTLVPVGPPPSPVSQ